MWCFGSEYAAEAFFLTRQGEQGYDMCCHQGMVCDRTGVMEGKPCGQYGRGGTRTHDLGDVKSAVTW